MKINNRIIQYATGIFFLLICAYAGLKDNSTKSATSSQPSKLKVSAATINENTSTGDQIRKIRLEITLFSNKY